jgi:para-aminobenzoate synthetase component 1
MPTDERIIAETGNAGVADWVVRMDNLTRERIPYLFILDFDLAAPIILPLDEVGPTGIRYIVGAFSDEQDPVGDVSLPSALDIEPITFEQYRHGFDQVMKAIRAGDTYLLNLCHSTRLRNCPELEDIYQHTRAPFKLYIPDRLVLFSPERFISIRDGVIRTFPMKGTIDASLPHAEEKLLGDIKEKEEHATVVDLLRNDLSIVAGKVQVDRYRFMSKIRTPKKTILQCSSEISGVLQEPYREAYGSIMQALLPAGSVTGAPKKKTVEIIKATEHFPRGYYTGVFGVFDGETLDSAVMIRMIEVRNGAYYYRSGGGITYRSQALMEYDEMIGKIYLPV